MDSSGATSDVVITSVRPADPVSATRERDRPHWPALDGLRGTAILAVLACHYAALLPKGPNGQAIAGVLDIGWAGVDLFFVLSGFLITGILVDAREAQHYFRNFYARRILRIFPLYYGFLALIVLLLLLVRLVPQIPHDGLEALWPPQPWLWTYTANFWIGWPRQWSVPMEAIAPLWSLSVEEQFYLIWPLVVFTFSRRKLIWICLGIMAGALLVRLVFTRLGASWFAVYTWTPTRADSLAAGGLLALLIRRQAGGQSLRKMSYYAGAAAGLLLLAVFPGFDMPHHPWRTDLLYTVLAVLFAALLFWAIDPGSLFGVPKRFYEIRGLRLIGRYSYGIYILHLPLMYLSRWALTRWGWYNPAGTTWTSAFELVALNIALVSGVAWISFNAYEKRFLRLKRHFAEGEDNACIERNWHDGQGGTAQSLDNGVDNSFGRAHRAGRAGSPGSGVGGS